MAVGHYQFEAIHPFIDGNGRTGRVVNILFLVQEGLLNLPILYLSRHIIAHKADYYRLLLDVTRDQAWEPWMLFMLQPWQKPPGGLPARSPPSAAGRTHHRAREARLPRSTRRELVDVIFEQPYCRIGNLVDKASPSGRRRRAT